MAQLTYKVRKGQTLSTIEEELALPKGSLKSVNKGVQTVSKGQVLRVPVTKQQFENSPYPGANSFFAPYSSTTPQLSTDIPYGSAGSYSAGNVRSVRTVAIPPNTPRSFQQPLTPLQAQNITPTNQTSLIPPPVTPGLAYGQPARPVQTPPLSLAPIAGGRYSPIYQGNIRPTFAGGTGSVGPTAATVGPVNAQAAYMAQYPSQGTIVQNPQAAYMAQFPSQGTVAGLKANQVGAGNRIGATPSTSTTTIPGSLPVFNKNFPPALRPVNADGTTPRYTGDPNDPNTAAWRAYWNYQATLPKDLRDGSNTPPPVMSIEEIWEMKKKARLQKQGENGGQSYQQTPTSQQQYYGGVRPIVWGA